MTGAYRRPARLDPREVDRLRRAVARAGRLAERGPLTPVPEPDRTTLLSALESARGPESLSDAPLDALAGTPLVALPEEPGDLPAPARADAAPDARPDRGPGGRSAAAPGPQTGTGPTAPPADPDAAWDALPAVALSARHLARHLVVTATRDDPAHGAFDVLRTRLLTEMRARGWRRLGITSPTKGCGKTFTAANLALTLSRLEGVRTLLLDLDMRQPSLGRVLGQKARAGVAGMLRGDAPADVLLRVEGDRLRLGGLALGLSGRSEPFAAELLGEARTAEALAAAEAALGIDVTLLDLPPVLAQDDVLAARPLVDALLLVAGGGLTTPRELRDAAKRIGRDTPILGVVLNRAEGEEVSDYAYAYR